MKVIQGHKLSSHTFPMNAPADVSPKHGRWQARGNSRLVHGEGGLRETPPHVWTGAVNLEDGSQTGAGLCVSATVCFHLVPQFKSLMAKSRLWGQLRILSEVHQFLRHQGLCFRGQLMRFRAKVWYMGRQ